MEKEPDRSCSVISSVRLRGFHKKKIHRETKSSRSPYSLFTIQPIVPIPPILPALLGLIPSPFLPAILPIPPADPFPDFPTPAPLPASASFLFPCAGLDFTPPCAIPTPSTFSSPIHDTPHPLQHLPPRCCRLPLNRRSASHLSSLWALTRTRIPRPTRLPPLPVILPPIRKTLGDAASPDQPAMFPPPMRFSRNPGHSPIMGLRWIGSTWRVCRLPRR